MRNKTITLKSRINHVNYGNTRVICKFYNLTVNNMLIHDYQIFVYFDLFISTGTLFN
jgi:hypothetical protein